MHKVVLNPETKTVFVFVFQILEVDHTFLGQIYTVCQIFKAIKSVPNGFLIILYLCHRITRPTVQKLVQSG